MMTEEGTEAGIFHVPGMKHLRATACRIDRVSTGIDEINLQENFTWLVAKGGKEVASVHGQSLRR